MIDQSTVDFSILSNVGLSILLEPDVGLSILLEPDVKNRSYKLLLSDWRGLSICRKDFFFKRINRIFVESFFLFFNLLKIN
jgi:hypothetical protein